MVDGTRRMGERDGGTRQPMADGMSETRCREACDGPSLGKLNAASDGRRS